ncbi:MAG: hypothetical protein HC915_00910 [Anaerolineae bacterium]|nr:hypothetical protein [Anaerolineae bacterium]
MRRLVLFLLSLLWLAAACTSPRDEAAAWADRFPEEITREGGLAWELDDRLQRTAADPSGLGHVLLRYESDDDLSTQVTIWAFGSVRLAELHYAAQLEQWSLQGATLERERAGTAAFDAVATPGGGLLFYQVENVVFQVAFLLPAEPETQQFGPELYETWMELILAIEDAL